MSNFISVIENFLDNEDLHYTRKDYEWGSDTRIGFRGETGSTIRVHIIDRENENKPPFLAVWDLVHIPDDKLAAAFISANEDNRKRYFRFSIDDDHDLNMTFEFPEGLTDDSFADVLQAMFPVFVSGCHVYFERYSRLIWGDQSSDKEIQFA